MDDPILDYELVPRNIDVSISAALAANPLITNSNRQIDLARLRQRSAQSDYFPRVDVVGSANYEDDREGTVGNRRDYSVTLQATWNLFSGFSTRSAVAEAAYGYSASINNHLFVNRRIEEEVRLAWQSLLTACDRRLLLVNAVTISSEVHASRVRLREAGQETAINVLDAEGEVFNAEINEVAAIYDEKLAIYRLAIAMGQNLAEILGGNYSEDIRDDAKERYEERCANRLETVALRSSPDEAPRNSADPFAAPADDKASDDASDEAANPFAAPDKSEDDEEASNPFNAPAENDDSVGENDDSFAAKQTDDIETEDDSEASATNPFASTDEGEGSTDEDDSISLKPEDPASAEKTLEDELEEDDDSLSNTGPSKENEIEEKTGPEEELNKDLDEDDKLSALVVPTSDDPEGKAETEWDDDLKNTTE
jgi:hypothetical protein